MKHPLTRLRAGVVLLFLLGFLSPVFVTGAGAQGLTCDDFNSERAAQAVLDADPDMEETLDPDGDGIACNHEEDASDDGAADEEDATDDGNGGGDDADAYLEDVADQAASWSDSLDELLDLDPTGPDVTDDDVDVINGILGEFAEAPDVAAEFEAPEGAEDVQAAFEDLADGYVDVSDTLIAWSETEIDSDEEADALAAFEDAVDAIADLQEELDLAIEDAGGSSADGSDDGSDDSTDDGADDGTDDGNGGGGDADAYVADVTDQAATWADDFATIEDIDPLGGGLSEDDVDVVLDIYDSFLTAPDVAAEFEAPEGLEDLQAAFEDLADGYGEVGATFYEWLETEAGSAEEADAADLYNDAMDAVIDLQDEFDAAVEDAGGSSADGSDDGSDATDDGADDGSEDETDDTADDGADDGTGGDADVEAYLEEVTAHNDELTAGVIRLTEILTAEEVTDDDRADLADLLDLWESAPDDAAAIDVPDGMEDVQDLYEEVADTYAATADAFNAWLETEPDSTESDDAWAEFTGLLGEATELSTELTTEIEAAG